MSENGFAESSRSGPLRAGERIQLTDAKGKLHTITLTAGATWQGHKGHISHDEIIGSSEGSILLSTLGAPYFYQRPLLEDFVLSMPRGATIVYPKDAAEIIAFQHAHIRIPTSFVTSDKWEVLLFYECCKCRNSFGNDFFLARVIAKCNLQ